MLTPAFSSVLRLGAMCGAEKVSQLLNHPVMSLFGTRGPAPTIGQKRKPGGTHSKSGKTGT
jgi:hypothetical protein